MAEKSTFDLILEAVGNLPGAMAKAAGETTVSLATAIPRAVEEVASVGPQLSQEGLWTTLQDRVSRPVNTVKGIAGNTYDFYTKPGVVDRMVADPARPLMDAASVLGIAGAGAKAAGMQGVSKGSFWLANKVDPFTSTLDIAKAGARATGFDKWLYKQALSPVTVGDRGLNGQTVDDLVRTSKETGAVFTQKGSQRLNNETEKLTQARRDVTRGDTTEIPFTEQQDFAKEGINAAAGKFGQSAYWNDMLPGVRKRMDANLAGTLPGERVAMEGRRSTNIPLNGSTDAPMQRLLNYDEAHGGLLAQNNTLLQKHYSQKNMNVTPIESAEAVAVQGYDDALRKNIDTKYGDQAVQVPEGIRVTKEVNGKKVYSKDPTASFIEAGREIRDRVKLRESMDSVNNRNAGPNAHTVGIEASNITKPTGYGVGFILDKTIKNPALSSKAAASINNKSLGPIAKGLRGARRTLFELGEHGEAESQEQQIPDSPFSSGYIK